MGNVDGLLQDKSNRITVLTDDSCAIPIGVWVLRAGSLQCRGFGPSEGSVAEPCSRGL